MRSQDVREADGTRHWFLDTPEAQDAELRASELGSLEGFLFPFAGVQEGVGTGKLAA